MRRISIRDKMFTECSEQGNILVNANKYEAVIVNAAFVSRSYYEGNYDPDKLMLPTCWPDVWIAHITYVGQVIEAVGLAGLHSK